MTAQTRKAAAHWPATRIVERVATDPAARPIRLLALLLPVWAVEIEATVTEAQPYEVFDRYLSRAISEAELRNVSTLADFFGMEPALVERGVRYLATIGHVQRSGDALSLTSLGARSVTEGLRYVLKEDRQWLYFDGFTGKPLPRSHYSGTVWLDADELKLADGTIFHLINGPAPFRSQAVDELARRADREDFNLPAGLTAAKPREVHKQWLPAYVMECESTVLVFVKAIDGPDEYLARVLAPYLRDILAGELPVDPREVWRTWLDGVGFADVTPQVTANGMWRAVLPASVFPSRFAWSKLGSFEVRRQTFLQLWCDDPAMRRRAVLERAGAMVRAGSLPGIGELAGRLADLAAQLEVTTPDPLELRKYAKSRNDDILLVALSRIE
ncbi:hypothetical protein Drose_01670 [Dactylosporangium roseum]|uniref:Uncharacterized protein n=1 Tax=Dactylosporangium roseum TaxID=47989 RepID=A0ABY5Z4U4_9ACTN|nr:hypothetical protein [Dactylosporangium roseum]UWZ37059.1 hypothetical protein Drose_01670 [Dactylosporangium roseum]